MLLIDDVPKALEFVGACNVKKSENAWKIPGLYIVDFLRHHSDYTRCLESNLSGELEKKEVTISIAYEASLNKSDILYGVQVLEGTQVHIISILAYSGRTQHDDFFSPFQVPYAASVSIDSLTYFSISMPFAPTNASEIIPLLVSWPKNMIESAERQRNLEVYLRESIENLVLAYERIRFPIPDNEQVLMAARLTSFHYRMQESVKTN
jgi:hypothetical protein